MAESMIRFDLDSTGAMQKHFRAIGRAQPGTVEVGWFDSARYPSGDREFVAQVAHTHEHGRKASGKRAAIPKRPFFSDTLKRTRPKVRDIIKAGTDRWTMKMSMRALTAIGEYVSKQIARQIAIGRYQPLSPRTLQARADRGTPSTRPLKDTGYLGISPSFTTYPYDKKS